MSNYVILSIAAIMFFAAVVASHRLKLQKLRKDRRPFSYAEFRLQLPEDTSEQVVQDVLSKLREDVGEFPFQPDDHVITDYGIDDEDLEDMLAELFKVWNVDVCDRSNPKLLPNPLTMANLIIFCNSEVNAAREFKRAIS